MPYAFNQITPPRQLSAQQMTDLATWLVATGAWTGPLSEVQAVSITRNAAGAVVVVEGTRSVTDPTQLPLGVPLTVVRT